MLSLSSVGAILHSLSRDPASASSRRWRLLRVQASLGLGDRGSEERVGLSENSQGDRGNAVGDMASIRSEYQRFLR